MENDARKYQRREMDFLESIRPALAAAIAEKSGPEESLSFSTRKEYAAASFLNFTVFRLRLRAAQQYFSVPTLFRDLIPETFPTKSLKSQPDFIRLLIDAEHPKESYVEFLSLIAGETVNRYPKEWDCCSRYMECSDAGKCVHPDKAFALECGYRKILASGRIFYGKRRNID